MGAFESDVPEQFSSSAMSQFGMPSQLLVAGIHANIVTQRYSSALQSGDTHINKLNDNSPSIYVLAAKMGLLREHQASRLLGGGK